jgi:hypothetical protein
VGRSDRGGIKAPSKPFSKLFQKSRVLLQTFPKKALAVLWDFKGLQGFQTSFDAFQIFHLRPPFLGRILDAAGPHSMHRAGWLRARPAFASDFTMHFCRRCVHRGSSDPDKENFQYNRQSDFWEEISAFSRAVIAGSAPASPR